MSFEHGSDRPAVFTEDWENQYSIFSWIAYLSEAQSRTWSSWTPR